jgi:cyclopropane fatty-acyl-phospholipid synthase-like methyltransferase
MPQKAFSQACENNKQPILNIIAEVFAGVEQVLEIGSGTGQHAVYFAQQLPHLSWQASDQKIYLPGIQQWLDETPLKNLPRPLELDVNKTWPVTGVEAIFSANTLHIMSWQSVENFFKGVEKNLQEQGYLCVYGPFNYNGQYTSDSNARFDLWLKNRDPESAIRNFEDVNELAHGAGLGLSKDCTMPANNRLMIWKKL